jgi:hypothetical protein
MAALGGRAARGQHGGRARRGAGGLQRRGATPPDHCLDRSPSAGGPKPPQHSADRVFSDLVGPLAAGAMARSLAAAVLLCGLVLSAQALDFDLQTQTKCGAPPRSRLGPRRAGGPPRAALAASRRVQRSAADRAAGGRVGTRPRRRVRRARAVLRAAPRCAPACLLRCARRRRPPVRQPTLPFRPLVTPPQCMRRSTPTCWWWGTTRPSTRTTPRFP